MAAAAAWLIVDDLNMMCCSIYQIILLLAAYSKHNVTRARISPLIALWQRSRAYRVTLNALKRALTRNASPPFNTPSQRAALVDQDAPPSHTALRRR